MSAVRPERRSNRLGRAAPVSPYARKQATKKSSWSLSSLLGFFNPLRLRASDSQDDSDDDANTSFGTGEALPVHHDRSAQMLSARGNQMAREIASRQTDAQHASPTPSLPESDNPLVSINEYLQHKKNMTETEVQQLADYVQKHTSPAAAKKHEPFRFTSIPSTIPEASTSQSLQDLSKTAPRRTISRNPNGVYRWEGGGSARKSRYSSPAFGNTGPASSGSRIKLRPPVETPKKDTKRRRVGDDAATCTAQPADPSTPPMVRSNAPSPATLPPSNNYPFPTASQPSPPPSPSPGQKSPSKVSGSKSLPALRTPVKPSIPAIPSPLRQTWRQEDSPPQPPVRQTKAASFMTGLIKEVVTPPKPDVSNPYQTASPVKPAAQPRKVSGKRPRATGKPTQPAKVPEAEREEKKKDTEKELDLTPQAIIEATIPKGSKRSRPPSKMTESAEGESSEKDDDRENEEHVQKKPKKATLNGHGPPPADSAQPKPSSVTVEEVEDVDMAAPPVRPVEVVEPTAEPKKATSLGPALQLSSPTKQAAGPRSSLPREPSKLRFSYAPEASGSPTSPVSSEANKAAMDIDAKEAAKASTSVPAFNFTGPPPAATPAPLSAREAALKAITNTLPSFTFTPSDPSSAASTSAAAIAAEKADKSTLPTFDFSSKPAPSAVSTSGFNWAAAGLKPPASSSGWKCNTCMCDNPVSAKDKCNVCDSPAPSPSSASSSATAKSFDWSAAGVKAPKPSAGWKCSTCMCDNPESAKDKCTVCDAPAPATSGSSTPSSSTGKSGFNWAAAGIKAPVSTGGWKCSTCMCDNPADVKDKCKVCEAPAPGGSSSVTEPPKSAGFNWAAAGMKAPTPSSEWTCSTCMCNNPPTATTKCRVCDTPK